MHRGYGHCVWLGTHRCVYARHRGVMSVRGSDETAMSMTRRHSKYDGIECKRALAAWETTARAQGDAVGECSGQWWEHSSLGASLGVLSKKSVSGVLWSAYLVIAVYVAIAETSEAAASLRWLLGRPSSSLFVSEERKERQYGVMRLLIRFSFALPVATRLG